MFLNSISPVNLAMNRHFRNVVLLVIIVTFLSILVPVSYLFFEPLFDLVVILDVDFSLVDGNYIPITPLQIARVLPLFYLAFILIRDSHTNFYERTTSLGILFAIQASSPLILVVASPFVILFQPLTTFYILYGFFTLLLLLGLIVVAYRLPHRSVLQERARKILMISPIVYFGVSIILDFVFSFYLSSADVGSFSELQGIFLVYDAVLNVWSGIYLVALSYGSFLAYDDNGMKEEANYLFPDDQQAQMNN